MSDERQRLAQMRQRLVDFRRSSSPSVPQPDPNNPGNPYNLPLTNMTPSRMPTAADAARAGAGFLQADMTAMIPMAIFHNLPPRLIDDFYDLTWAFKQGRGDIGAYVAKMQDHEIANILREIDAFPIDQLTAVGAKFYEALIEESDRRKPPATRIRVVATPVEDARTAEADEHHEQLPQAEALPALPARTFPGPLLKSRT